MASTFRPKEQGARAVLDNAELPRNRRCLMSRVDRLASPRDPHSRNGVRPRPDVIRLRALTIGFVNIMPDAGFEAAEQSFLKLIEAGAAGMTVRVRRYTLPGACDAARRPHGLPREVGHLPAHRPTLG